MSFALLCLVGFFRLWDSSTKKHYHYSGPSPMRPNELWTWPPGLAPGCQRRELLGSFEKEEEGIGIASDVFKMGGKNLITPR